MRLLTLQAGVLTCSMGMRLLTLQAGVLTCSTGMRLLTLQAGVQNGLRSSWVGKETCLPFFLRCRPCCRNRLRWRLSTIGGRCTSSCLTASQYTTPGTGSAGGGFPSESERTSWSSPAGVGQWSYDAHRGNELVAWKLAQLTVRLFHTLLVAEVPHQPLPFLLRATPTGADLTLSSGLFLIHLVLANRLGRSFCHFGCFS